MHLDHVSYAVSHAELSDTVQRIGAKLGASFRDGGRHPSFGTCNFFLPLANGMYIEIVSPLDHPAAERAPFGKAVRQRVEAGGGWMAWVVAVGDMGATEQRLGREAVPGHRVRPDGYDLQWRQIGVNDQIADPQLPFFVEWISPASEHPSVGGSNVRLHAIEIAGDADAISEYLGEPRTNPLEGVHVSWIEAEEPGIQSITFDTAAGLVVID